MRKKRLQDRIARRNRTLCCMVVAVIILVVLFWLMNNSTIAWIKSIKDYVNMCISAAISTVFAIYVTREDILSNDYSEKKDDFGVVTFEEGFESIFRNGESNSYLGIKNWKQFFEQEDYNGERKIYFVGISFSYFFENPKNRKMLYELCLEKNYTINIILANPFDSEVEKICQTENKVSPDEIKQKIMTTYKHFQLDLETDEYKRINEQQLIQIRFSNTVPTMLLIKSGKYMIITPYMLDHPSRTPTIIVEDSKDQSFFEQYSNYINVLLEKSKTFEEVQRSIPVSDFFTQSYTNLSEQFYKDIKHSDYVAIIGLSHKRMLTALSGTYQNLLSKGVAIDIILTDPDGESTKMSTRRSSSNRTGFAEDVAVHKDTINRLIDLKDSGKLRIYTADFLFPFTLFAFNCKDEVTSKTKMYIWQTILFEPSEKRPGFLCEGEQNLEMMKLYYSQFIQLRDSSNEITEKFIISNSTTNNKSAVVV